ncbi:MULTISPECIES: DM13 domain-containing protein [Pseudoalteromonas]|uniref:DM13 domain-containing protein n=1 Tax=Pseudoalteromonas TaxID=53246 RepID=UPI001891526D|nr:MULTISPECIES: DM13 domain-containing protein [Pseudoalteromonas]MCG7562361.1 DM13 domain-containing protein [Pseudoalteromonas sp. McH1-42]MEC4087276.1 DM13 domain-containing protein [Pseudoalteromonas rubra]
MTLRALTLIITHGLVGFAGFAGGIYMLPILTAPPAPNEGAVTAASLGADYSAQFRKSLQDSDALHWGEGMVSISKDHITLLGELAPGPDYRLYLSPQFVETEADFNRLKSTMVEVGDIKTFSNFVVDVPQQVNPADYNTVIVWCEAFGEFITAAQYQ